MNSIVWTTSTEQAKRQWVVIITIYIHIVSTKGLRFYYIKYGDKEGEGENSPKSKKS